MLKWCVLVGLDWAEPMMSLLLHITCSCIFHAYIPSFIYILILKCLVLLFFSLSLSLSFVSCSMAPKRKSIPSWNPLHSGASSSSSRSDSTHDKAFIRNAKSFYRTFSILTFPLSSTVGVGSHCVASQSLVPPWSYKSFTPKCMDSILQYLILSLAFEVHAS